VEGHNQTMQEGEPGTTLKKLGHLGTDVEGVMPPAPGLQGGAGHLKLLGRLTLGDALSLQPERVLKEIGLFEPVPELVTVEIVAGGKPITVLIATSLSSHCQATKNDD
jgi:hypothetical protein